ncbi:MAG: hypothetical protein Q4D71_11235, partial [Oscillospiraceae bacterium]|nr:hypothetical protein [Oscillospiraceae bacterium]
MPQTQENSLPHFGKNKCRFFGKSTCRLQMSQKFDCSNGLSKDLCLSFVEWDPNWRQKTQEQRVALIRTFAEYLIRHEIPAYL